MELTSVPGVGEKTAAALSELDDPEAALRAGDVAALARAPGLSEGRAASIARGAIRMRHEDPGGWTATTRARELHRDALDLLQERAVTTYGEKRLETLYPSAVESRIQEVRDWAREAMDQDPDPAVIEALEGVDPLTDPTGLRVRERCLATADAERYAAAEEAFPELSTEVVEDARDLAELARSYATVIVLDEGFAGIDVSGDVQVRPDALDKPGEIVPERLLSFFAENRDRLLAAATVQERSELDPPVDPGRLRDVLARVDEDGTVDGDEELERLTAAAADVDAAVSTAESVANDHLREAVRAKDVTIKGGDFLSLVEQGARVDSLLARELSEEYDEALRRARAHLVEALSLTDDEREFAERVFGGDPTFPVERDSEAVSRLRRTLETARDRRASRLKSDLAADLAELRDPAEALVRDALELDVELAVAQFADEFDCSMPTLGGEGFQIEGGQSPLLNVPFDQAEPIDYGVESVTLLSGVNSGGKTSTLDLVALVTTLAHMGLPVPAEQARVARFSELHYYAPSQGTLDAGAFEATLREFATVVDGADGRLVLVDELESITEPGASAKIIAGILEELAAQGATAVFVSHLAREIRDATEFTVPVDGIEALGLDDGELVVDRSPRKNHLARSTPELIVEKLAGESDGEFYERLLEKF